MKLARRTAALCCGCMVLLGGQAALANEVPGPVTTIENQASSSIHIGTEIMDGDTTYQIGYPVTIDGVRMEGYFPFSELKWPLDIVLVTLGGSATFRDKWRVNGVVKSDISDPDDNMEDSDWLTDSDPSRLDVFSESSILGFQCADS